MLVNSGAFLCGSRVHGVPKPDSDVDMCILVTVDEAKILGDCADISNKQRKGWGSFPVRYGNLNLIVCYDKDTYDRWKQAISILKREAPTTKERAIEVCNSFGVS